MRPTVKIGFDLSLAGSGDFFTLDDPAKGVLDGSTYKLVDDVLVDVSADVRSLSVRRGRARETAKIDTGTANIVLDNRARKYDPTVSASVSVYGPSVLPRKAVSVELDGEYLFRGQVEDWDLQYDIGGDSVTVAECADGFALLGQQVFSASAAGITGLSGSVVYASASVAGWPLGRVAVDDGKATIGAHTVAANTNVLAYLQDVVGSEPGLLFIDREGRLRFRDRTASQVATGVVFTDDGSGVPFRDIRIDYGTELLYTRVEVEWVGGSVSAENTSSVTDYGLTSLTVKTLLSTQGQAEDLAEFLVQKYGRPVLRIIGLSVQFDGLTSSQKADVLGLELGDSVEITFTPNGIGDPIEQVVVVDSVEHSVSRLEHVVSFNFSETLTSFVLDDSDLGVLDEDALGF